MSRIGIHTLIIDTSRPDKSHAWISVEKNGFFTTYSLYADDNERARYNAQEKGWDGSGTHVREGVDRDLKPTSSRLKEINPDQERLLDQALQKTEVFGTIHNNCSHFASRIWESTTGESLSIDHDTLGSDGRVIRGVQSPVGLEASIQSRNLEHSLERPAGAHHSESNEIILLPAQKSTDGVSVETLKNDADRTTRLAHWRNKTRTALPKVTKSPAILEHEHDRDPTD